MPETDQEKARLETQLRKLRAEANANELKLRRAQERELSLLEADSLEALFQSLTIGLCDAFGIPESTVVLWDPEHEVRHLLAALSSGPLPDAVRLVDSLARFSPLYRNLHGARLGPFESRHARLFRRSDRLASVAILPLIRDRSVIGSLNLGSGDRARFTQGHATDFLDHLAVIDSFCLENAVNRARLRRSGFTDVLTGWHNRRYLEVRMSEEVARMQRNHQPLGCLMIDIDRFKEVNDSLGHLAGDEVLRQVAARIANQVRFSDVAARFGGEEFIVLLPDTHERLASNLAERIRRAVSASPIRIDAEHALTVTVSIGVAARQPGSEQTFDEQGLELIEAADEALYRAKKAGRDRVVSACAVPILNEID